MGEFSNPEDYELWMGRWSARLAPVFVAFAGLPEDGRFLDVGSGTGVLAAEILSQVDGARVVGIEPAESYVRYCRTRFTDARSTFEQGDATDIRHADGDFDATLSLLILQELPDAPAAVHEMRRVTRAEGCVAASQWNFRDGMAMLARFWDAVVETIGTEAARAAAADCMNVAYPDEKSLAGLWREAGLVDIETDLHEIDMRFESFEDYWAPFLTGVTPTSSYALNLNEMERARLEECLREKVLGRCGDGPFTLSARAWAVRGVVPASTARD